LSFNQTSPSHPAPDSVNRVSIRLLAETPPPSWAATDMDGAIGFADDLAGTFETGRQRTRTPLDRKTVDAGLGGNPARRPRRSRFAATDRRPLVSDHGTCRRQPRLKGLQVYALARINCAFGHSAGSHDRKNQRIGAIAASPRTMH